MATDNDFKYFWKQSEYTLHQMFFSKGQNMLPIAFFIIKRNIFRNDFLLNRCRVKSYVPSILRRQNGSART